MVINKFGKSCFYCGSDASTLDHIIPHSKGGGSTIDNLIPACRACNCSKGHRRLDEFLNNEALQKFKTKHQYFLSLSTKSKNKKNTEIFPIQTPQIPIFSRTLIKNIPLPGERLSFIQQVFDLIKNLTDYQFLNQKFINIISSIKSLINSHSHEIISNHSNKFLFMFNLMKQLLRTSNELIINKILNQVGYFRKYLVINN